MTNFHQQGQHVNTQNIAGHDINHIHIDHSSINIWNKSLPRRKVVIGSGLAVVAAVTGVGIVASALSHRGTRIPPTPSPAGQKWAFPMQATPSFSPLVNNGMVYTSDGTNLYALDAALGKQKWAFPIRSSGPFSPPKPKVANDLIYIYSGFENGISLYALDTTTGVQKWRVQTADTVSSISLPPPPIVSGGIIYTSANSTTLYALDALSGRVRWTFQNGEYGFVSTVAEGVVYTTNVSTTYALNAVSGAKIWTFQNSSPGGGLVVANGTVYISGGNLYALDAATGNEKWSFSRLGPDILSVVNSTVYTFYNKILYALDATTGREKWHFWQASDICSSPVVDKGMVYIGSGDGHLYALDETSGDQKWAILIEVSQAGQPVAPIVNHGMIYLSDSTNLQVLDMSGKQKWSFTLGIANSIIQPASPTIANGLIYVNGGTNTDGSLGTKLYGLTLP